MIASDTRAPRLIVSAEAEGKILASPEGLSFWGGVESATGTVIDAHHPLSGQSVSGKVLLMPTSRGSCSGSGVLLDLALNGRAPAVLVFRENEDILTLGAVIADRMFDCGVGVIRLSADDYAALAKCRFARLTGRTLLVDGDAIELTKVKATDLSLSSEDKAKLGGARGEPVALAMDVLTTMAAAQGARQLTDVTRGHIDGCIYAHPANLLFAETMAEQGAKVEIPTTINAISVERDRWDDHGLPPTISDAGRRLADAYVRMGARPTFTCAPYLLEDRPAPGEDIGWSESNAVIFANSVLGARTAKHPDYLDLFIAMTGRAPLSGVYLTEARRPGLILDVDLPDGFDDALWPLLGWVTGTLSPDRIPLLCGLSAAAPDEDALRALCAAFGTTSAAPMLHVASVTPEADLTPLPDARRLRLTRDHLTRAWQTLNTGGQTVDLVALGSPHMSLSEMRHFARLIAGHYRHGGTEVIITAGRAVLAAAKGEGVDETLRAAGVQLMTDLCWCSIIDPILPPKTKTIMTNSGKYAHYAPGLSGRAVRFGSLQACADAALTGLAPDEMPDWLRL